MTLKRFWKSVLIKQEENGAFLLLASQGRRADEKETLS